MKRGVYLIGAGPGDKKLITVKGMEILKICDVVVYDQLINPVLLYETKEDCKKIYVGKKSNNHTLSQENINKLLLDLTKEHSIVVRLKGGDPFVFGRGSEEAEYLIDNNVYVEVISGITSAIGGLCAAGIPITQRNIATSFHVITGHISKESDPINYAALSQLNGTLVFLMGIGNLSNIINGLIFGGMNKETPVAIIYKASTPEQKLYKGTLNNIVEIAKSEKIEAPALIVIGKVINFSEIMKEVIPKELSGANIVVTRSIDRISKFSEELEFYGGNAIPMPTIKHIEINKDLLLSKIKEIRNLAGIIFSSALAVDIFFKALFENKMDARILFGLNIVVVGKETGKTLKKYGIITSEVPEEYSKNGILKLLEKNNDKTEKYLIPISKRSDRAWFLELERYITPIFVDCYDVETDLSPWEWDLVNKGDYITFTSASTVAGFIEKINCEKLKIEDIIKNKKIVAIGPSTKAALEENNIKVDLMPEEYTISSMVQIIVKDWNNRNGAYKC